MTSILRLAMLAVLASGCSSVEVPVDKHTRYRVALDRPDAEACVDSCQSERMKGTHPYAICLRGCPGIQIAEYARCKAGDTPPEVECVEVVTREMQRRTEGPAVIAFFAGVVVGAGATAALVASAQSDEPSNGSGYASP